MSGSFYCNGATTQIFLELHCASEPVQATFLRIEISLYSSTATLTRNTDGPLEGQHLLPYTAQVEGIYGRTLCGDSLVYRSSREWAFVFRSILRHICAGMGIFEMRAGKKGDFIITYCGRVLYESLSSQDLSKKIYGSGIIGVQ